MSGIDDKLPFYDRRRPLGPVPGCARDFIGSPVNTAYLQSLAGDPAVQEALRTDDMVLPAPEDREGYYETRHLEYWLSGYYDAAQLHKLLPRLNVDNVAYLDLGGCSGRVARHMARHARIETWLCDINASYIDWLDRHSTRDIRAFQNRPVPALPFDGGTFDVISAFSVFSHIAEGELHWILELKRILRPGGFLYLTVLDEATWEHVRTQQWLIASIARGTAEAGFRKDLQSALPSDRYVIRYSDADAYNCNVFYRRRYMESKWGRHFSSLEFVPMGHFFQTCAIFRK